MVERGRRPGGLAAVLDLIRPNKGKGERSRSQRKKGLKIYRVNGNRVCRLRDPDDRFISAVAESGEKKKNQHVGSIEFHVMVSLCLCSIPALACYRNCR